MSEKTENLDPIQISISEKEYTPRKTDMEPDNGHLEETYFQGFMLVLQGHILGNVPTKKKHLPPPRKQRYLLKNDGWKMTFLFEMVSFQQTFHFLWGYPTLLD